MKKIKILKIIILLLFVCSLFSFVGIAKDFSNNEITDNSNLNNDDEIDFSSFRYVALGDSITYGYSSITKDKATNGGYPQLVKNTLGLKDVINYGVCGAQTSSMINNIDKMYDNADIVSFMGGTNDCYQSCPIGTIDDIGVDTFYGRMKLLAVKLKAKYPNSFLFFMTPYKSKADSCYIGNQNGNTLKDYANVIIEICNIYNIPVLDMYNYGQFELEMFKDYSDGTHPSEYFYENYSAPQISNFIKENYK